MPVRAPGSYPRGVTYVERLTVPAAYWLIAVGFGLTFILAIGGYFASFWFVLIAVVGLALIVGCLLVYGGLTVRVDESGVRVGRSLLEWAYVGDVRILDADDWRRRLGPDVDARAFLRVRPYLRQGVEITVEDAADPHPYWLVGSRHPADLVAAISAHRTASGHGQAQ